MSLTAFQLKLLSRCCVPVLLFSGLSACSSVDETPPPPGLQGVLIDSAVSGMAYSTPSFQGTTGATGNFEYREGEQVTFSIGGLRLPAVAATQVITPLNLMGSNDSSNVRVVNLARLLQSLDGNANPDDGIDISAAALALSNATIELSSNVFDEGFDGFFTQQIAPLLSATGALTLVTPEAASAHLQASLAASADLLTSVSEENEQQPPESLPVTAPEIMPDVTASCGSTHSRVGQVASFRTLFHEVAGQMTVVDDCTLQVSMFDYDGGGPAVYFYAGLAGVYETADAFIIGERLDGRVFNQAEITLKLPAGQSLDDFDGISVWCADFRINFGDARF